MLKSISRQDYFSIKCTVFCSYYFGPWTLLISPQYLVKCIERNGDRFIGETSNKVEYPPWISSTIEGWNTKTVVSALRFELSAQQSPIFVFKNPFKSRNKKRFHFNFCSSQIEFQFNHNFPFFFFFTKFRCLRVPSYDNYYQSIADAGYFDPNSFQLNDNHCYDTYETESFRKNWNWNTIDFDFLSNAKIKIVKLIFFYIFILIFFFFFNVSQFSYPMNIIKTNLSLIPLIIYLNTFALFSFKSSLHALRNFLY